MFLSAPSFGVGFAAGFGTGFLVREIFAAGATIVRPVARATVKTGLRFMERSKETFAGVGESFDDLVAEARSELATRRTGHETRESAKADKVKAKSAEESTSEKRAAQGVH